MSVGRQPYLTSLRSVSLKQTHKKRHESGVFYYFITILSFLHFCTIYLMYDVFAMNEASQFERLKSETEALYKSVNSVICPYFGTEIIFNSKGFHHLQFSSGTERDKAEQILKFSLFKYVTNIIKNSGTIQEYRKTMGVVNDIKSHGEREMKVIQYWGLIAIVGQDTLQRIKVILRKVGTGPVTFWSVMPDLKKSKNTYKFASEDIEE